LPPPDLGLTNSTGRRGGSAGRQPEAALIGVLGRFTGVPWVVGLLILRRGGARRVGASALAGPAARIAVSVSL